VASNLYNRLKRIKQAKKSPDRRPAESTDAVEYRTPSEGSRDSVKSTDSVEAPAVGLEEWREVAPLVLTRETRERVGTPVDAMFDSRLLGRTIDVRSLRFMDTETTGLSGGAGTTVFLVGAGTIERDTIRVRQTLLVDFPGEPEFLHAVADDLAGDVWVSYNGKAFDAKLLESRFLMNGIAPMAPEQLDLLYWARRLWRTRIESCALSHVEGRILGRGRTDDIPGFEIPERYFRFLRDGNGGHLRDVFEHHRLDIVSLVHLFLRIERVLRSPLDDHTIDHLQLARRLARSDEPVAMLLYERAAASRNPEEAARAALALSRIYRRYRRTDDALRVLSRLGASPGKAIVVEMAKILEHERRDPAAALELVQSHVTADPAAATPDLMHRLARLRRKALPGES
jgi:uncharacterized protein YprB with RNaseH-like and TPR domain